MITLQKTHQPLGISIGLAELPEAEDVGAQTPALGQRAEDVIAEAEAVVALARAMLADQAREEVVSLRRELGEARAMIEDLERMLEQSANGKSANQARVQPDVRTMPRIVERRPEVRSTRAQRILDQEPLFLDYETTGLSKRDKVVEVCVIDAQGQVLLSSLVNPGCPIPASATSKHEIRDADVVDAPTWEEIAPALETLISGRVVVAHNASFESKFTPEAWGVRWECSKKLCDGIFGKAHWEIARRDWRRSGRLEDRLRQCGLQAGPDHTAAGDCISALRLVRFLAGEASPVELIY